MRKLKSVISKVRIGKTHGLSMVKNSLKSHKRWFIKSTGVIGFFIILSRIDVHKLSTLIKEADLGYLGIAFALIIPIALAAAWRWRLLLKAQGILFSAKDLTLMYLSGLYVGMITPGRLGEFIKVYYLKERGFSLEQSLFSVLLDKLFDLLFLLLVGYLAMFSLFHVFERELIVLSILIVIPLLIGILLWLRKELGLRIFGRSLDYLVPDKIKKSVKFDLKDFGQQFKCLNPGVLLTASLITTFCWLVYYLQLYLLAYSLGINISVRNLIIFVTIASLVSLIPITISGLGTRDATLILLFGTIGLSKESAVAFAFFILCIAISTAIITFPAWLKRPIKVLSE